MENLKTNFNVYTHVDICKRSLIDENIYKNFKTFRQFTKVLEHTAEHWGHDYTKLLYEQYKNYVAQLDWKKLKENDIIGSPTIVNFLELKDYFNLTNCSYSPSTIHYIYTGLDIIDKVLKNNNEINILEIGGGYGGQCKILLDMCEMLNIKIENYGIVDLEYVSKLQSKYLNTFGYKNIQYYEFENLRDFEIFKKYNILVSVYALGEFPIDIQDYYINNIVKNINNYYLVWNTPDINKHFINKDNKIVDETPKTGKSNMLITNNEYNKAY